jgi:hypothetical protein
MEKKNDDYKLDDDDDDDYDDYILCDENTNKFVDIALNIEDNYVENNNSNNSNNSLELMTLRQRSPSPYKISRSLLHNNFSTDSLNTIQKKHEKMITDISEKKTKKTYIRYVTILLNHVLIQLSFLAILEPLLFFNYIIGLEEVMFYEQLDNITDQTQNIISDETAQNTRDKFFYNALITFIIYEHQDIDGTYNRLKESADNANDEAMKVLSSLKYQAFQMALILNLVTFFYTIIVKYIYKKSIVKMLIHHITLIIFIGLFEIWFFTTIGSKYFPWSSDEIYFHLFQCFWIHTTDKFPELKGLEHNVTITCDT